jgi:hypothetical protein
MSVLDYEIRVQGRVRQEVLDEIAGAWATVHPVETTLRGVVADREALNELINRLQGLGLDLIEMRRLT